MIEETFIEHQTQIDNSTCVSTCLSMLTKIPVGVIVDTFHQDYCDEKTTVRDFLESIGLPFTKMELESTLGTVAKPDKLYLITVPSVNRTGCLHYILAHIVKGEEERDPPQMYLFDPAMGISGARYYVAGKAQSDEQQELYGHIVEYEIDALELLLWLATKRDNVDV